MDFSQHALGEGNLVFHRHFEELLKNNDKMTKIQLDLEKQLTKVKNDINQQTIYVDKLYKDKLKGLIDEEMFKRQYNNLTTETYNLKKKANELETKLFTLKNEVENSTSFYIIIQIF